MDHKFSNSNSIFGIYIHELAYILIFKAFAYFLAELLTLVDLCHFCHLWHKWQRHISIYAYHQKISYHNFQSLAIMKIRYFKLSCSHFHVSLCVSATCAICDTSGKDLPMSITLLENVRLL